MEKAEEIDSTSVSSKKSEYDLDKAVIAEEWQSLSGIERISSSDEDEIRPGVQRIGGGGTDSDDGNSDEESLPDVNGERSLSRATWNNEDIEGENQDHRRLSSDEGNGNDQRDSFQPPERVWFERELPHAYPVNENVTVTNTQPVQNNDVEETTVNTISDNKQRKIVTTTLIVFVVLVITVVSIILKQLPSKGEYDTKNMENDFNKTFLSGDTKNVSTASAENSTHTNLTMSLAGDDILVENQTQIITQSKPPISNNSTSLDDSSQSNNVVTTSTCLTDPMVVNVLEFEVYERGDDPSIPRTYIFCPNSTMNIFHYHPSSGQADFSTGDAYPILLFLPNVNLLCGDGSFENNCTFAGGFAQITFRNRPAQLSYELDFPLENITIQGFRFTGATYGSNIAMKGQVNSATIKDCRFDYNHNMFGTIQIAPLELIASTLSIHNCTFEHNTFSHNPHLQGRYINGELQSIRTLGVIFSYPAFSPNAIIKTYITDCLFHNNTFFLDPEDREIVSASIINLLHPVTLLEINHTCFMENKGYSTSLVLLGGTDNNDNSLYSGNSFVSNTPANDSYEISCVVNHNTIYDRTMETPFMFKFNIQGNCSEYIEIELENTTTNDSTSGMCVASF